MFEQGWIEAGVCYDYSQLDLLVVYLISREPSQCTEGLRLVAPQKRFKYNNIFSNQENDRKGLKNKIHKRKTIEK